MEKIIEDASIVQNCLPWIKNDKEIIHFMRKIPIDMTHLRIPIAIKFFLNIKDKSLVLEHQIENDAKDVITILPNVPYQDIKKQLKLLGNISNRKEVIFRLLLNGQEDVDNVLKQINFERKNRKRSISGKYDFLTTTKNKISKFNDGQIFNAFNVQSPIKKNIALKSKNIVKPATLIIPENTVVNMSEPSTAVTIPVPDIMQLFPTIPEIMNEQTPLLQELTSNVSQNSLIPSRTTSLAVGTLENQFRENKALLNTDQNDSSYQISNKSEAGPSTENGTNGILIDLVENEIFAERKQFDEKLVLRLIEMFPETCPDYIRDICVNKNWSEFDELVSVIIDNENHPKRQISVTLPEDIDKEDQFETVKALLPDADPTYLRMKCEMLEYKPEDLNQFIIQASEKKDYPTMKEYLRNQQLSAQSKQYTTEFCTEQFVLLFPEPHITFNDSKRLIDVDNYSKLYITQYFQNKYDRLPKRAIYNILVENNFKIVKTNDQLMLLKNSSLKMKTRRKHSSLNSNMNNILVLQEIAYLEHKNEIESYIKTIKEKEEQERQYAKDNGLMNTCQCCFDNEVMLKDTFYCPKDCLFCKNCIRKSCEIAFAEGKTCFKCLNDCSQEFSLQTLQKILMPKMFSKIAQKKMIEDIKAAGIEDLEMCPFCDFATIPNEQDKIFKCLNPDCMKESCRNCKEPNHVPLHCDEIEKDENVKARVFIENKMTEAFLCECWKCGTRFFKEEGCNKMTCTCGAQMCYICKKPVKDYTHFNGMGGDKYHLCPLYSDNKNLHQEKVLNAVKEAKAQIDQSKLIVDPSENLEQYYKNEPNILDQRIFLFGIGQNRNI